MDFIKLALFWGISDLTLHRFSAMSGTECLEQGLFRASGLAAVLLRLMDNLQT